MQKAKLKNAAYESIAELAFEMLQTILMSFDFELKLPAKKKILSSFSG